MATESFLINPPKRLRRKVKVRGRRVSFSLGGRVRGSMSSKLYHEYIGYQRRKSNPIGETLVTIGANPMRRMKRNPDNPWYGDPGGHRIAALMRWGKIPRGRITRRLRKRGRPRVIHRAKHRKVKYMAKRRSVDRRTIGYKQSRKKQYSQLKGFLALTSPGPSRRFRYVSGEGWATARRRKNMAKRRRKSNTWFGQPRRHSKAAKKGWRRGHLVPFTHSRRSRRRTIRHNFFTNPMVGAVANPRHRRRRHTVKHRRSHRGRRRQNPAIMAEFGKFTSGIMNVREWGPLAVTGGLSAITGAIAPGMLGVSNPWMKLGVQTAVAIGGGIVVERVVDKRHGQAWMIVGVAMVGYQLLKEFVFMPYFPQFAVGLGGYNDYYPTSECDNRDNVSQQIGAFPSAMGGYPGVGAFENEVGAYPYDGSGY